MKPIMNDIRAALVGSALLTASLAAQNFPAADISFGTAVADGIQEAAWDAVPANPLTVDIDGTTPEASDLSGYWKAMWDADNLYFLMVTMDDTTIAPGSFWWNFDMTEIFLDTDLSAGTTYDGVNDSQFVFPRDGSAPRPDKNPLGLTLSDYGIVQGIGIIVQEVALPWSELAVTPAIGMQMGLDVYMKDNDTGNNNARDNQISWSPSGDQAWKNASLFGTVTLVAPRAVIPHGAATADGSIDRIWNVVAANPLTVDLDKTSPEASDLSGYWKAMWDEDNLYLLVVTTDDITTTYPGTQFWNYDITEIFLDTDYSRGTSYDGVNDAQLVFPRDGSAPSESSPLNITFGSYGIVQGTGVVIQEIALPWSELAATPSLGVQLGLDVYLKDNDTGLAARDNQVSWSPSGDQAWNNASLFGTVTLGESLLPYATASYGTASADGVVEADWDAAAANDLTVDLDKTSPEASDLSGYWKAMWDADNLYLLVVTTDDITTTYPGTQFWNYDVTEIFLDTDYSRGTSYDGVNDAQLVFPRDGSAPSESSPLNITFGSYGIVQGTGMVIQEIALPWSELAATPSSGAQLGLDVYMKDNDSGLAARDNQISWSLSQDQAWRDTSLFGTLILGHAPVVIPEGEWSVDPDFGLVYGFAGSWAYSADMGFIHYAGYPWIYQAKYGWMALLVRGDGYSFYYSTELGWLYVFEENGNDFTVVATGETLNFL